MAVWEKKWYIVGPLVAIILGHWPLLIYSSLTVSKWAPGQGCVIISTKSKLLSTTYIYGMSLDFIVLILTASKLVRPSMARSRLMHMIFADGLYYFVIAYVYKALVDLKAFFDAVSPYSFLANLVATVCIYIQLDIPSLNMFPA
jgi:hypothetical protein